MTDADALSPLKRALLEIRELRARQAEYEARDHEPIAVVGAGMRLPGGVVDRSSLWALLESGTDAIEEVPASRWDIDQFYDPDPDAPGRMATRWGGFLPDVDQFDAAFFGISHREAVAMDPQQRLLLTASWEALEDASIPPDSLFGTDAGVFVGIINSDYLRMVLAEPSRIDSYAGSGNALSVAAGRIAYVLGAEGPAISYDTACSSSLVSVHAACQSLRSRESSVALAGGVGLILTPELTINHSHARMMAADGRCKTFDARADGYVRSEGCAMVVLKRLSDAQADGDRILATIRGSAVNQDGRSGGLTAPHGPSQERVIRAALTAAGVEPEAVSYVEAHGTGTPLGDPIEMQALHAVYGRDREASALQVGSVKTNIGHTEATAGIAGLLKVVTMLEHAAIPPHLHLDTLSPHLEPFRDTIAIPTETAPWIGAGDDGERLAGVSSFGLSGTNAHVIVGAAPPATGANPPTGGRDLQLFPISSRHDAGLSAVAGSYATVLQDLAPADAREIARAAALGRTHLERRAVAIGTDAAQVAAELEAFAAGSPSSVVAPAARGVSAAHLAQLYSGHGALRPGAGAALHAAEPVFAAGFDACAEWLREHSGIDLHRSLLGGEDPLTAMRVAQPALFALQYGLAEFWASIGSTPTVVAGHSAGEYVAAVRAGALRLEDGLLLISERGRLMDTLPEAGKMVAVFAPEAEVVAAIGGRTDEVDIAAVNGPTSTIISGRAAAVDAVVLALGLDDDEIRPLDISVAAHSPLVEPILDSFRSVARQITASPPSALAISSTTAQPVTTEWSDPEYWVRHLRAPVRFGEVFERLGELGVDISVEIGPHRTLAAQGERARTDGRGVWVASMRHDEPEVGGLMTAVSEVFTAGGTVEWEALLGTDRTDRPHDLLPSRPWVERSYWTSLTRAASGVSIWEAARAAASRRAAAAPLGLRIDAYDARWELTTLLSRHAMINTLLSLGGLDAAAPTRSRDEIIEAASIVDEQRSLVHRWLDHLTDAGVLRTEGDTLRLDADVQPTDLRALVDGAAVDQHGIEPLLDYLLRCADALPEVLTGNESPLSTLFPDGSYEIVDYLYHEWDIAAYHNGIIAGAVAAAAAARGGRLRVLEVGAGTGGTARWVLPELEHLDVEYHFTDISDFFLARARERSMGDVRLGLLDLEQSPAAQGWEPGSFDIVIGANVLHATTDLDTTLGHVRDLLAPGGVLIALEGTSYPIWPDVSTGLIEGWQRFTDEWRDDIPLLTRERWHDAILANGFEATTAEPADDIAETLLHHVLLARAPGAERPADAPATDVDTDATAETVAAGLPSAASVAERIAGALADERPDVFVAVVREVVSRVLRAPADEALPRDLPLLDLGFDSLMAVELRNSLREVFALDQKLPATLAFDQPTIGHIAAFLDDLTGHPAADGSPVDAAPAPLPTSSHEELDDEDVEAALLAKLEELDS